MKAWLCFLILMGGLACLAHAYPVDGTPYTGIERLEGVRLAQQGQARARKLPAGGQWTMEQVSIRLTDNHPAQSWNELPPVAPELLQRIRDLLGEDADRYGIALLDLSDASQIRYAEHNGTLSFNPGSVGKVIVALAVFQALADLYPDDIAARERVLRTSMVTADRFIVKDSHRVPLWSAAEKRMRYRPIRIGDRASFWTYLDWMMSASSNAAASMVMRELQLLRYFGKAYPVSASIAEAYLADTKRKLLSERLIDSLQTPITRNGLDLKNFRQGGFFTWQGKRLIPGSNSNSTARELLRFLLLLEQGQIVDSWSSREIKRLLYMTGRRIRYASSPALKDAAVYFKSGSLYSCKPEPDFVCKKYHGNVRNMLNSVAIIEEDYQGKRLHYLVVVLSNVLRKNSAVAHQTLATRLHRLIQSAHQSAPPEK